MTPILIRKNLKFNIFILILLEIQVNKILLLKLLIKHYVLINQQIILIMLNLRIIIC